LAGRELPGVLGEDGVEVGEEVGGWFEESFEVGFGDGLRLGRRSRLGGQGGGFAAVVLEAAELVDGTMEEAVGSGSGALDGAESLLGGVVEERVLGREIGEVGFSGGTAAEAPGGPGDFGGEGFLEEAGGAKLGVHGFAELFIEIAFLGLYVVGSGVEAEGQGVAGGGCFARVGAGAGAESGVLAIGVDLWCGCHFRGILSASE
jgi:hypothetical protein